MQPKFIPQDVIDLAWSKVKANLWNFIGISLISAFVQIFPNLLTDKLSPVVSTIALIFSFIFSTVIGFGILQISLRVAKGESFIVSDILPSDFSLFLNYVGGSLLKTMIIICGFILLIIPGLIWAFKYMFVPYLVFDKKMSPIQAVEESAKITYGHKWSLFVLSCWLMMLNLLGVLCLVVGLFITIPITWVAIAHVYLKLSDPDSTVVITSPSITE